MGESLHETKRDLVRGCGLSGTPIPVPLDHLRKVLVGFESLPLQRGLPVLEKPPGLAFDLILPSLAEGFLQQRGHVESLVGAEEFFECHPPLKGQGLLS